MTFYHTLLEQYAIMESLESVIASNPHIPKLIISGYHKDALPDNNKKDRLLNHVLKLHNSGAITPDNGHLLKPHLTALAATNQLNKLGSLNTLEDHINATKDIMDKSVTKKERIDKDTHVILNTPDILVRQHLTHESAIKAARLHPENPMYKETAEHGKAQWCVSMGGEVGKTAFDHYTETGKLPMYTIFNKKTNRVHALVASPNDSRDTVELRNEIDKQPYTANADLHTFLNDHPGLGKTPAGLHLRSLTDEHMHEVSKKTTEAMNDAAKLHVALLDDEIPEQKRMSLLKSPHLTETHINDIISNKNSSIRFKINAIRHKLLHPSELNDIHSKALMDILNDPNSDIRLKASVAESPRIMPEHADNIINSNYDTLKGILITRNSKYITPEHVNDIMGGDNYIIKRRILNDLREHITPQHIHNIIMEPHSQDTNTRNSQAELTKRAFIKYPHYIKDEHIRHIMKVGTPEEKSIVIDSNAFKLKHHNLI